VIAAKTINSANMTGAGRGARIAVLCEVSRGYIAPMPSAFAVLRLTISSNFVGCWIGKFPGSLQNFIYVTSGTPRGIGDAGTVSEQPASVSKLPKA